MSERNVTVARTIRLWTPITATWDTATARLEMKPPNIGNPAARSRNQTMARTRSGVQQVYDRGIMYNDRFDLHFQEVIDSERSNLVSFMDAVQWGSSKLIYQDMYGDQYKVRFASKQPVPQVTYLDQGEMDKFKTNGSPLLWDFDLELLNITDNLSELAEVDPPVTSALGLHLLDFDDPHSPETVVPVDVADGAKVVEGFACRAWKAIVWYVVAEKNAQRAFFIVSCENNGYALVDATAVDAPTITQLNDLGTMAVNMTFTVDLNGAGTAQMMRLKAAAAIDGVTVRARRMKLK